jgi:hypothetical protein
MTRKEAIEVLAQDLPCETDEDLSEAMTMAIKSLEKQEDFIKILFDIQEAIWEIDIPSPTVPEYVEHHNQMQELLALIDTKIKEIDG